MSLKLPLAAAILALAAQAQAQSTLPSGGALVIVPAFGEVTHANDLAFASFSIEEQDRDKAACASRVNQKMKQGTEIIRAQDPQATFKTQGYYTYPVYPDERPQPNGLPQTRPRVPTAWRVGQVLEVTTTNLAGLPKTQRAYSMLWQPMSNSTPPPERSTSQNQGSCGPSCSSHCLTRKGLPNAPSSTSCFARAYFGAKINSSA